MGNKVFSADHFVKFFLDELYSKTHFKYEHNPEVMGFFEEDDPYTDHIMSAQEHLKEFILSSVKDNSENLTPEDIQKLYEKKMEQVFDIVLPEIEKYIKDKVTVDVIWPDSIRLIDDGNGGFRYFQPGIDDPALLGSSDNSTDIEHGQE